MQEVQSYNTAISRKKASAPLRFLQDNKLLKGTVLDYGCGKGADGRYLTSNGYTSMSYDPYWNPINLSGLKFDTILCTYVLNVVDEKSEDEILSAIKNLLAEGGEAFISVRRDIKKDGPTTRGFQRTVNLNLEVVKENSGFCIYKLSA